MGSEVLVQKKVDMKYEEIRKGIKVLVRTR